MKATETAFLAKYPSLSEALAAYSPAHWAHAAGHPDRAHRADVPTLRGMDAAYGAGSAARWVGVQVTALYAASPKADPGAADGIPLFAQTFAAAAGAFKVSEVLLFFARYAAGRYDDSFASFDTRRIGNAFFGAFARERAAAIGRMERAEADRRRLEEQERWERYCATLPEGHTPRSWYEEVKRRAAAGDEQARRLLLRPEGA